MKRQQSTENTRRKIKRSVSTPLAAGFRSSSLVPNGTMTTHHIPYRNSLLTTVLRDSLGGNCKSCFLLTISLDSEYFEESISTLRFDLSSEICLIHLVTVGLARDAVRFK